mmetsp:Transcript_21782/g.48730  ORF Transcript_21782/g.48730 Transcript_21782/m.48730 type:complete len:221 (-) Transcript_21782:275-937(-)
MTSKLHGTDVTMAWLRRQRSAGRPLRPYATATAAASTTTTTTASSDSSQGMDRRSSGHRRRRDAFPTAPERRTCPNHDWNARLHGRTALFRNIIQMWLLQTHHHEAPNSCSACFPSNVPARTALPSRTAPRSYAATASMRLRPNNRGWNRRNRNGSSTNKIILDKAFGLNRCRIERGWGQTRSLGANDAFGRWRFHGRSRSSPSPPASWERMQRYLDPVR